jgi:hypothetical protein
VDKAELILTKFRKDTLLPMSTVSRMEIERSQRITS